MVEKSGSSNIKRFFTPESIGIVGYGIVGQAVANGFYQASGETDLILYHDKYKPSSSLREVVENSKFVFICLPTPMKRDESGIDLSIVEEGVSQVAEIANGTDKIIAIKSTVVPGTTEKLAGMHPGVMLAFNPEFLTEVNYLEDFLRADRTIIGANNDLIQRSLAVLYKSRFPSTNIFLTDPTTAEMVKYAANAFLAVKVSVMNQFHGLCEALGINYEEMIKMVVADSRIGSSHTQITSLGGFGGKCFPKDIVALIGRAHELGSDVSIMEAAWGYNKRIRRVRDWDDIPGAVEGNHKFTGS